MMYRSIDLMIVGAHKAGTTSLFHYIAQHPEVYAHPQSEFAYFLNDFAFEKGYEYAYKKFFSDCPDNIRVLLAKHAMLMYSSTAVDRLYQHNNNGHLVIILRNPIDRAYSAYWYARRRGWEILDTFEKGIDAEKSRLQDSWIKWRNCAYIYNSTYYPPIVNIIDRYKRNQFQIFLSEDLRENPIGVIHQIYKKFDIESDFSPIVGQRHNRAAIARSEVFARIFANLVKPHSFTKRSIRRVIPDNCAFKLRHFILSINEKPFKAPDMDRDTRRCLVDHFKQHNMILGELIERDLSCWNR